MLHHYRMIRRNWSEEAFGEGGFTLIELLIVIVVLGILAATVIFALGGVTGQSAKAACNSDAKSIETAVEAYHSFPGNSSNSYPDTLQDLITGTNGSGKFIHSLPNSEHYYVGLAGDLNGGGGTPDGTVFVTPNKKQTDPAPGAGTSYDSTTNPCSLVN